MTYHRKSQALIWISLLSLIIVISIVLLTGGYWQVPIQPLLKQQNSWWISLRLLLLGLMIGGWPLWIRQLGKIRHWSASYLQYALKQRWRIALWLILVEIILVDNVIGYLVAHV